ncbi:Dabb family protein [Thalassospira sp. MCCC 1A01428]|uniref:Dabb family protein n=1 Tax=unclassified Thalassospira TaxID=2648997 RepID=UPI000A1E1552|nr:Dabb family protein [Thalassospira sp. MCCC 1A01428]OSQ43399.1 stress responsive protein [Thalassospira sp. MCCC 1A01428]
MIRHIVLVNFKPDTSEKTIQNLFDRLAALRDQLPGMRDFDASPSVSPENLEQGFNHGICVDFVDEAARDAYLVLPDHKALGGELVGLAEGGIKGLVVFDLKLG